MIVNLFGSTSFCGEAFKVSLIVAEPGATCFAYSRSAGDECCIDLASPSGFSLASGRAESIWVSFAPVWLFAPFFRDFLSKNPHLVPFVKGVIVCSSSSVITKRYSSNSFDIDLVRSLGNSEDILIDACHKLGIPCRILRPALIYGSTSHRSDQNLGRLTQLMRRLPLLPIPQCTGLRQPIHVSQLVAVVLQLAREIASNRFDLSQPDRMAIGGDSELSYADMLKSLQEALPASDPAKRCRLIPIPNRIFFFFCSFLLLFSPKTFEAVLRMSANLAGFIPSYRIHHGLAKPFPVLPLA